MSVVNRIRLGFGLPLLMLGLIGALSYQTTSEISEAGRWVEHTVQVVAELKELGSDLNQLAIAQRSVFQATNQQYEEPAPLLEAIASRFKVLRSLTFDNPQQQKRLNDLEEAVAHWSTAVRRAFEVKEKEGPAAALAWLKESGLAADGERVRQIVPELQEVENQLLKQRHSRATAGARRAMLVTLYGTIAAVLFGLFVSILIARRITGPVRYLAGAADRIGSGELDYRIKVQGKDELSALGTAFNSMAERLKTSHKEQQHQASVLQSVLNSMGEGVIVCDTGGNLLFTNPTSEQILGRKPLDPTSIEYAEKGGLFLADGVTSCPAADHPLLCAIQGKSVDNAEMFVRHSELPQGAWITFTGRPLKDGDGVLQGGLIVFRDTTDRKRNEDNIEKLNEDLRTRAKELETVNKELEAFSYSVSHDLRAPLRHIDGFSELLQKKAGDTLDDASRRYAVKISGSAKEMGQLIDDLLAFSRVGRLEMRSSLVSLDQMVREEVTNLDREAQGRNLTWKIGTLPSTQGDSAMLRLAVTNLLSNAVKYTRTRSNPQIEVGCCSSKPGEIALFVRDNGVGFDMSYADKLFGVFQRLHSASEFEGTGIGLANVRRIIHRHGGKTWAHGAVDEGATFYFSLPGSTVSTYSEVHE